MESHGTGLVVETAIYFHDAVYNVASPPGWNEKCSAELARSFLYSLGYHTYPSGYEFIQKVEGAILATVHDGAPTSSPSTKLMLDLDLAGFADAWELFEVNNKAIRQEYASVSDQAYKWGRLKFLAGLAARPAIFYVLTELESPARRNIERHMGDLLADRL